MSSLLLDVRYGLRLLWKSPSFTLVAILALALGIGANTAIFSVVDSVLLRPLPFRNAGRLAVAWESSPAQGWNRIGPSGPNYLDFRDQNRSFEDLALLEPGTGTLTGFGEPQQVPALRVTTNFLRVIGFKPALGRDFRAGEGWNQRVVILSDKLWQRDFNRDPDIIGKTAKADGLAYTIIGVLPRSFWFPDPADMLVPWSDSDLRARDRMSHDFGVIGHLKPGVSVKQATVELSAIERRIGDQFVGMKGWQVTVVPIREALDENIRTALYLVLGAVAFVLLIACANLGNLMLARAAARGRETAIRMALGAGRWRLIRQFLSESLVLSLIGGAMGLLLAAWGVDFLDRVVPETLQLSGGAGQVVRPAISLDGQVLLFTLMISLASAIIFGLAPAIFQSNTDLNESLQSGGRGLSSSGASIRSLFAISEVALALVLLICSALSLKSFWHIQQVKPGFIADRVLALEMELPTDSKYRTAPEQSDFFRRVLEKVQLVPGIRSAAVTSVLPLDGSEGASLGFLIEGRPPLASGQRLPADYRAISPDFFRTMGIPLLHGRYFSELDTAGRPLVVVINDALAKRYWPDGQDPIGQRLRFGRMGLREIVGIVGDVKHSGLDRQATPTIYTCYLQSPDSRMSLVVRTAAEPASMIRAVKDAVYSVDKDQPMYKIRSMDQVIADAESSPRLTLVLLSVFAAVALALASLGIYGVISFSVTQRTREIGIRMALGAQRRHVLRLVVGQGLWLSLAGVAAGLTGALGVAHLMASLLFGVSPSDPGIFAGASAFLAAMALAATYIPARRATSLDPTASLRHE
ncbi:MAG TPA: ABC transporter permease [Bryobacteraceae bacterium]|nr:ABC transporter permease [Bryobacteraceae bacterium]